MLQCSAPLLSSLREMERESIMKFVMEKLKELLVLLPSSLREMGGEGIMNFVMEKPKELLMVLTSSLREMERESTMKFVMEKLKELLVLSENFGGFLAEELEKVFPAESREEKVRHWIQVGTPYLIRVLAIVFLYYCLRCCRGGRGGGGVAKTMKAPGRGGHRIPRAEFASNPSGYFRSLHADRRRR